MMDFTGPTPEAWWQQELDRIAPRNGKLSWLKLVWVPGDPWEPVHRWFIYQMMPIWRAPAMIRDDLMGRSPRERGYFDKYLSPPRFVPDPECNVDRIQWELYQETKCYGRPYWVVQGYHGGHKRRFTRTESVISRMNGGPKDPANPGDLPYAKFDQRVVDKLARLDLVRAYSRVVDFSMRSPEQMEADEREMATQMKERVWGWLESQVQDALSGATTAKRLLADTAVGDTRWDAKYANLGA